MIRAKWRCSTESNRLKDGTCCCSYCEGFEDGLEAAGRMVAKWLRGPVQTDEWDEDHQWDPDNLAKYIEDMEWEDA